MVRWVRRLVKDDQGANAVEYALLAGIAAVALLAGGPHLAAAIRQVFEDASSTLAAVPRGGAVGRSQAQPAGTSTFDASVPTALALLVPAAFAWLALRKRG